MNKGIITVARVFPPLAQDVLAAQAAQPGLLNFVGDCVQASSGELDIPITQAGTPGMDYSQLRNRWIIISPRQVVLPGPGDSR